MGFERKFEYQTDGVRQLNVGKPIKNIYWAEVTSNVDATDGGLIKARILGIDPSKVPNENLPEAFPLLPKFFHVIPRVGELVRIFIPDVNFPNTGRLWIGSIISQPHKIGFDEKIKALSTTHEKLTTPDKAPSKITEATGIYPKLDEIAIMGRNNTDIVLSDRNIEIRVGKHEFNDNLKLNKLNPASIKLSFDQKTGSTPTISTNIVMADRIGLITHSGIPKFKAYGFDADDRDNVFKLGHPIPRGDVLVRALSIIIEAILNHSHPSPRREPVNDDIINNLKNLIPSLNNILNENIVIN